ncbi:MAG: hypothetical protein M8353_03215 [ANME-2 cluster archaeon]|nr:hypothetical protein [ANME-2 cluster archaeon]
MPRKNFTQTHQKIMDTLKEVQSKNACTSINLLAQNANTDSRTVRKHLEIAEIDDIGRFTDEKKTIFCIKKSMGHLFDDETRLAEVRSRWKEAFGDKTALEILNKKRT